MDAANIDYIHEMSYSEIDIHKLSFSIGEIAEVMGYGNAELDEVISEAIAEMIDSALNKVRPSYYFSVHNGTIFEKTISVGKSEFETGKIIGKLLRGSDKIALFVATAGIEFELWSQKLKEEGDYLSLFIADSIGTCIVEKAGDFMERHLEKELGELKHTNRFSPGYCGWHVSEQKKLFKMLPENICGVELKESCLMVPIKSISGIIGIGPDVKAKVYSCNVCDMDNCYLRRNKRIATV